MTERPLFGGAMTCRIPNDWRDVSDVRQVPDHQECWQDMEGRALIVEILERQPVPDDQAAQYFFVDLAEANDDDGALFASLPDTTVAAPGLPNVRKCFGTGYQHVAMGRATDFRGNPRQQEMRWIRIELCVLRLPDVNSDLLVTLSSPVQKEQTTTPPQECPTSTLFTSMVGSLQIRDWSLFGHST